MILFIFCTPLCLNAQTATEYNFKGVEAVEEGEYKKAIRFFNKAIKLSEKYDSPYYNKGLTNLKLEKYQEALSGFSKAIEVTERDSFKVIVLLKKAYVFRIKMKDLKKGMTQVEMALEVDPISGRAHYMHGLILYDLKKFEEAIESFDKAVSILPSQAGIYYDRALAKRQLNQFDEAIKDYTITIELDNAYSRAYNNRGFIKMLQEDYQGAIEDYDEALEIKADGYAFNNRGFAKYKLGNYESAKKDCEKSIRLIPENSWAYHYLGLIHIKLEEKEKACELLHKSLEMGKDDVKKDIEENCLD